MKLIAYLRRSREDDGYGLTSQESAIREWADRHGHEIVEVCTDNGVNGSLLPQDRPGLADAISLIDNAEAEGLVVHHTDRIGRHLHVQEAVFAEVWKRTGHVFDTFQGETKPDDPDDPYRTFVRQVMGAAAQLQKGITVANMRRGKREKSKAGGYTGGHRFAERYGYELRTVKGPRGKKKNEWVPVAAEQEVIQLARRLRDDGLTLQAIADQLNEAGHPTKSGGRWHPNSVRRLLGNRL